MKAALLLVPVCLVPFAAGAPGSSLEEDPSTLTPHESVQSYVDAVRGNDVVHLVRSLTSEAEFAKLEAEWELERKRVITEEEELEFRTVMTMLTQEGAEDQLMELLLPELDELRPQMTMFAAMMSGMGEMMIQEEGALSDEKKEQSAQALQSLTALLLENDLCSPEKARRAVDSVCAAVRSLELESWADLQALSFAELLEKGNVAFAMTKDVLDVYGLAIDEWLDTFEVETVQQDGDTATVRVRFEFLGIEQEDEVQLTLRDGRWIQEELTELALAR